MVHPNSHRVSRVPWYLGTSLESRSPFVYGAVTRYGGPFQEPSTKRTICNSLIPLQRGSCDTPRHQTDNACRLGARLVWADPRSLAATDGIAFCFLFLGVLRWFTSPRWPSRSYVFTPEWRSMTSAGFSHSEIPGSTPVCGSPRLIAAGHVLHRLSAPRHPPCTLSSLTKSQKLHTRDFDA